MKHNHNHDNAPSAERLNLQPVRFEFTHPTASKVCVAGTFNHWQSDTKPMHSAGEGHWIKETALAPGSYEYCFVVDGHFTTDPAALETVPNPFGGRNSVLTVHHSPEIAHLANAENTPLNSSKQ